MKVELTFDLTDDKDYTLWAKIAAALSGSMAPTATETAPPRPKLTPQPAQQPAAAAPQAPTTAAPAQPTPPPVAAEITPPAQQTNGSGVPSVQELREALGGLGAVTTPGEAADFLRLQIGSPNLSSIPEDKRAWAMNLLKTETANRQAMA